MNHIDKESIKIAVLIRVGRVALGLTQQELADMIGIAKITLARVETLESKLKVEYYMRAMKVFHEAGIEFDAMSTEGIKLNIKAEALEIALGKLSNDENRRKDRNKPKKSRVKVVGE
jgi:transcriptional regulator with XRE-family HTH domain